MSQPKLYILSRPTLDYAQIALVLSDLGLDWRRTPGATEAEEVIEFAGRTCYLSFGPKQSQRQNSDYIRNLIVSGHESVLEHASWTLLLTNVSRAFTHQLVRHRVGVAFSQLSQQYHDESEATFVAPTELEGCPEALDVWKNHMQASLTAYRQIGETLAGHVASGVDLTKKERNRLSHSAARSVLPNSTETKIVMSANARAWRHFLSVRGDLAGDYEMRIVAMEVLQILRLEAPAVFLRLRGFLFK